MTRISSTTRLRSGWSVYGDNTKRSGFARLNPDGGVESLRVADKKLAGLARAKSAEVFLFTEQSFDDSPDIFVAGPDLNKARQVTKTNPFQEEYEWGTSELIDYENDAGVPLQGALFYPAGYEQGKKYPMIVYIYEKRSQNLHAYSSPSERSAYNPAVFTSLGYFVYQPDIVYRPQNPGLSAIECVVPAVKESAGERHGRGGQGRSRGPLLGRLPDGLHRLPLKGLRGGDRRRPP